MYKLRIFCQNKQPILP